MVKLTEKQRKWCEVYAKTGNATQAAVDAGYNGTREQLKKLGAENKTKQVLQKYIREVLGIDKEKEEQNRIASIQEVMQFYSDVMNGKIKDQFGLEAQLSDRIKAAQSLDKVLALAEKAKETSKEETLVIEQQYGRDEDE